MKYSRLGFILFLSVIVFIATGPSVSADIGPKPTLVINVNNIDDDNYYLDLLGKIGEYSYFGATDGNQKYDLLHDQPIYNYSENGWKAIHMRTWLLRGKLTGDPVVTDQNGNVLEMRHSFGYVGVPKRFKIIIQKSDGSLLVSDEIKNGFFNTVVNYDMKENKVVSIGGRETLFNYLLRLATTAFIEIMIAFLFFYRNFQRILIIAIVNLMTQTLLTAGMTIAYPLVKSGYYAVLTGGEVLVFIAEYLFYIRMFGKADKKVILFYTILANLASFLAGISMFP